MTRARTDVIVVGGGLAGLATATYIARAGRTVTLFEKASAVGGRATTHTKNGFYFNLGPHALYRGSYGIQVLNELGVQFTGGVPGGSGAYGIVRGEKHTLPGGFVSLLSTGLLSLSGKLETARFLGAVQKIDPHPLQRLTVHEWLEHTFRQPDVRQLIQTFIRVATYTNDPQHQSAGAAVAQLQTALKSGVCYVDGGWQTLVDGLRNAAQAAGVQIEMGKRVQSIDHDPVVRGVRLADGTVYAASAVIIAGGPSEAAALIKGERTILHRWAEETIPVTAACLDVALTHLPKPRALIAFGVDQPWYLSVHSAVAKLAPNDSALIHVAKYLNPHEHTDPKSDEHELETLLDLVQPGWRKVLIERRFLPHMVVSHALVTAVAGGLPGRPGPTIPGLRHVYVVGDWVGSEGLLADASLVSAKRAAHLVLQSEENRTAAAA
jgi:phytoene dehydrogenase-like protein